MGVNEAEVSTFRQYCIEDILNNVNFIMKIFFSFTGEVFDYLVAHGRMKEKEARAKFRQVS